MAASTGSRQQALRDAVVSSDAWVPWVEPAGESGEGTYEFEGPSRATRDADESHQNARIGSTLAGTYRLERVLGAGAMASVFAATHVRNANKVAVKVLHPSLRSNDDIRGRFLREGYAANIVGHPGVVRALDDGVTDDGCSFLVMELLDGETLEAMWSARGHALPACEVADLMAQLLDVLAAAHTNGVVHRDIKPENLFVERDGTLRVLDFGVARVLEGTITETRAGSIIGTIGYMAPEQMLGKSNEVDARSDLWSVGATAFTLLSGHFVHDAETPQEMLVFTASRQARAIVELCPGLHPELAAVVDRALRLDKVERWPSAAAMRGGFVEARAAMWMPAPSLLEPRSLENRETEVAGEPAPARADALSIERASQVEGARMAHDETVPSFQLSSGDVKGRGREASDPSIGAVRSPLASEGAVHATLASNGEVKGGATRLPKSRLLRRTPVAAVVSVLVCAFVGLGMHRAPQGSADANAEAEEARPGERAELPETNVASESSPPRMTSALVAGPAPASVPSLAAVGSGGAPVPSAQPTLLPEHADHPGDSAPASTSTSTSEPVRLALASAVPQVAAGAAPVSCSPPYMIVPGTGKKRWKRECL